MEKMSSLARQLVGDLFLKEVVMVLFCTQTLALGEHKRARG